MIREALAQLLEKGGSSFMEQDERQRRMQQAQATRQRPLESVAGLDLGQILGGSQAREAKVSEQTVRDMLAQLARAQQQQVGGQEEDLEALIGLR